MNKKNLQTSPGDAHVLSAFGVQRRNLLKFLGISAAVITVGSACNKDDDNDYFNDAPVGLGSGDIGVLNLAYTLEQIEAAFYMQVVGGPNFNALFPDATERLYLTDIRDNEMTHRAWFKAVLGSNAIPDLSPDFSGVDFNSRLGILNQARTFEDTGVYAYNGAGKLLTNPANLLAAGKIVSVEARQAAVLRDMISPNTFAAALDVNAKDPHLEAPQVIQIANNFLLPSSRVNGKDLPTS